MQIFKKIPLPRIKKLTLPQVVQWGLMGLAVLSLAAVLGASWVYYVYVYQLPNAALDAKPKARKLLEADLAFLLKRFDERAANLAATTTIAAPSAFQ
ncbi:MAG: hypothetical protein A3H71_00910 [Candidatus Sungbacteria bacterium RIFCSPLOWO2_02_FULL_48_13b]|uniref:Uncharacterized protein n=2 Tax=Candidatus Sungiibacteriota TaxID=1817917 RepID=A0A1G2LJM5_9BACT|nr:MAG: hypothetical protein A3C12_00700 [Candidatus Sungbacteria bacterium RIFCSPHIGHO2_02_FULL_49_20]OHA11714.1 MAG: hypothetical protein A3H71_00910 [Candidatus Sungbacteria bacterium RIFCSPLOWO2_02_FULL_48_13b]